MKSHDKLLKAVEVLSIQISITSLIVNKMLKTKPRLNDADGFKYFVLKWCLTKRCRILLPDGSLSNRIPTTIRNDESFNLIYKDKLISLAFTKIPTSITAILIYTRPDNECVTKAVTEKYCNLPSIGNTENLVADEDTPEKDEVIHRYSQITYSLEAEFFHSIFQFLLKGKEVRSTPATPKRIHS